MWGAGSAMRFLRSGGTGGREFPGWFPGLPHV